MTGPRDQSRKVLAMMQKTALPVAAAAAIILFASQPSAGGPRIEPGEWEITTRMEMPMFPAPKVDKRIECIDKEQAERDLLAGLVEEGNCTILDRDESGSSVTFEVECTGDPSMPVKSHGKGEFTGEGKTFSGNMRFTTELPQMPDMPDMPEVPGMPAMGGEMTMTQQWTGTFLGPCQ